MSGLAALYRSVVGKKVITGVTGGILMAFLLLHVAGNMKTFLADPQPGVPDIDVYAEFLRTMGEPLLPHSTVLWTTRIVLIVSLILHVICVVQLALLNKRARPVGYANQRYAQASPPARWMLYTGALVLVFAILHILQFTTGDINASSFVHGAVYANLYRAFSLWYWVAIYVVAMAMVALHLYHGAWSLFQSLGLDNPDRNRGLRAAAAVIAVGLFLGFTTVPVSLFTGVLPPPPTVAASAVGGG